MEFNGAILTRNNEFNVRVEMYNTLMEKEVYSVLFDDEKNEILNRVSVRRGQDKKGGWKWGTLNNNAHSGQIRRVVSLVKQSGI